MKRVVVLGSTVLFLAAYTAELAHGATADASKVNPFYGSFGSSVPIAVPKFHGLEPSLNLTYSSTSGNGWLGVGWILSGFSAIERASAGQGAPAYNASDVFLLDGQLLVPCAGGSTSPSCTSGGTHSTEIENYQRIAFNSTANTWTVTSRDGTATKYSPVYVVASGTFRWGVTGVVDTKGNAVVYQWWCDGGTADCYPHAVAYDDVLVTLFREARPDAITFAVGGTLGQTNFRVKTIDVVVGQSRARSYKLTYSTSGSTSRSVLAKVQQFGTDAIVDATGTVASGTSLPPFAMSFPSPNNTLSANSVWGTMPGDAYYAGWPPQYVDVNGDGKADVVYLATGLKWKVQLSTGTGFSAAVVWGTMPGDAYYAGWPPQYVDVNGDGKADVVYLATGLKWKVQLSTGTSFLAGAVWGTMPGDAYYSGWPPQYLDLNSDGKADIIYLATGLKWKVQLSTGTSFLAGAVWGTMPGDAYYSGWPPQYVDVNGDGKTDIIYLATGLKWKVQLNTGASFLAGAVWGTTPGDAYSASWPPSYVDVNGDGKTDIVYLAQGFNWKVQVSTGRSFLAAAVWGTMPGDAYSASWPPSYVDLNGDGKADVIYLAQGFGWKVQLSTGIAFSAGSVWASMPGDAYSTSWPPSYADVNGDGRSDVVYLARGFSWKVQTSNSTPDLVTGLSNGLGGTTTIGYSPSSAWTNTYLPPGMVVSTASSMTTSDGRGGSSTTSYSYEGGLWSAPNRRFLGFRKVAAVIDAAGNYTETYYHQGVGCISKPDATYLRDPAGSIFAYSSYGYSENGAPPYTSLLTSRWDYECNQTSTCRRLLSQMAYDEYANATGVTEYGDYDVAGDERTTVRGFRPNATSYLVLLPAYENVYSGVGSAGPLVKQTLYRYDGATTYTAAPGKGLLTAKDRWKSQPGSYVTSTIAYALNGNQTVETDEDGHSTTHAYDARYNGFETRRCNALNQCMSYSWDTVLGIKTAETDANGTTRINHDAIGRATKITSPSGAVVNYEYLNWGDPAQQRIRRSVTDGSVDGLWSDEYNDGIGRVWRTVKKGGFARDTLYSDTSSRIWKESLWYASGEPPRYEVYSYDGVGRLRTTTHADDSQAQRGYGNGTESQIDEVGNEHVFWKDGLGNATRIRERNGATYHTTVKEYDVLGNLTKVTDANGAVSSNTFDSLSRRIASIDADLGARSYQYSAAGLLVGVTDAAGQTITFQFDAANRNIAKVYPDGTRVGRAYDETGHGAGTGRLTSVTGTSDSESFTYNVDGQVTAETRCIQTTCKTFQRSYDGVGRLTALTYPDGEVVTNTYDPSGRLSGVSGYVANIAYDAGGAVTSLGYTNGTTTSYAYDPGRRWLTSAQVSSGAQTLYQASYAHDASARVSSTASTTNPFMNLTYGYDGLNRLVSVSGSQSETIAYDPTGNITSAANGSYAYADPQHTHAVTAVGTSSYSYDVRGNMISGGGRVLAWDYDNRLRSSTVAGISTSYLYDADGKRVAKQGGGITTLYFGDLAATQNGVLEKNYYAGALLVAKQSGGEKSWYHSDHLGSIRLMTTATGSKANSYDYTAWGGTLAPNGSVGNEIGFGGHHTDVATGLVYMNARYYDPLLHRFVSADTVVPNDQDPQALNRYSFGYNNPVSNTDPTGHAPVAAAAIGAMLAAQTELAWLAVAVTAAGYVTNDPMLMTLGSIMAGCAVGLPGSPASTIGGLVAASTSPLSPVSARMKQNIQWAYSAYGLLKSLSRPSEFDKASPGTGREPNASASDSTTPKSGQAPSGTPNTKTLGGSLRAGWKILCANLSKVQPVGFANNEWMDDFGIESNILREVAGEIANEGGGAMAAVSMDSGFHVYAALHDTLIDTIGEVTGWKVPGTVNFASNVVLIGIGLRHNWFGGTNYMESSMRSAQYARGFPEWGQK